MSFDARAYNWAACAIELLVTDINISKDFYLNVLKFENKYERVGFIYMDYFGTQIMLDERNGSWETGEMQKPYGRGINLQIETPEFDALYERLKKINWPLYQDIYEKERDLGGTIGLGKEFLVQDPDGYLLRFAQSSIRQK